MVAWWYQTHQTHQTHSSPLNPARPSIGYRAPKCFPLLEINTLVCLSLLCPSILLLFLLASFLDLLSTSLTHFHLSFKQELFELVSLLLFVVSRRSLQPSSSKAAVWRETNPLLTRRGCRPLPQHSKPRPNQRCTLPIVCKESLSTWPTQGSTTL